MMFNDEIYNNGVRSYLLYTSNAHEKYSEK